MRNWFYFGLGLTTVGILGFLYSMAHASYYEIPTNTIFISEDASQFDIQHEYCHRTYFTEMNQGERNRWEAQFTHGSLNYCYTMYPFTYSNTTTVSIECFADLCSRIKGNTQQSHPLQYWYGYDGKQSKEYIAVQSLLFKHQ